jgi:Trk K+ transport system NAD-binding subunit
MGVMVLGIRRASGERLMPPPGSTTILAGDSLFAFGSSQAVNEMLTEGGSARR